VCGGFCSVTMSVDVVIQHASDGGWACIEVNLN